ncbi:MAG TPA: cytochrome c [Burkholderiales bacterium]|nr:cytochrome c [Burkholderiales bacterium]
MSTFKPLAVSIAVAALLGACATQTTDTVVPTRGPNLGRTPTAQEIRAADISIPPSGAGLPAGSGDAKAGAQVYASKCLACHGEKGAGKPADALVGGIGSLATPKPLRTVGSYWPYATTLFDYTRRAMPLQNPKTLTDDEVYAVSAYILFLNGIIAETAPMNAQTLPLVKMPNRDGFVDYSRK